MTKLEKDIDLLKECISHWRKVKRGIEEPYVNECSLCQEYYYINNCNFCPIKKDTDLPNCVGSPFIKFIRLYKYGRWVANDADPMLKYLINLKRRLEYELKKL